MTERRQWLARLAPAGLIVLLAVAMVVPQPAGLDLAAPDRSRAQQFTATLDELPARDALVLLAFDPDLGTYAEVRPTVRAVLADLVRRDATLAVVSLTPEGRALAIAELDRLASAGVAADRVVDLGYRAGAEAGLVQLTEAPLSAGDTPAGDALGDAQIEAVDLAIVVGGGDIGPRSWIEQVAPRAPDLALAAVAPTVQLPELEPFVASRQLAALLGSVRDGAAYRDVVDAGQWRLLLERVGVGALPLTIGILVALVLLGRALATRGRGLLRRGPSWLAPSRG
jgi:hypothetical protein